VRLPVAAAFLALAVLGASLAGEAQPAAEPVAETVWIPIKEKTLLEATRELRLEGFLHRPAPSGRFPVLVFNHGSTGAGRVSPTSTTQYQYPEVVRFFLERGWAVLIPMRRGRGASEGDYLERYECDRATLTAGVERGIEDVEAALAFVSAQPWADPGRLLLGGQSRGGLLSVLYPSRREVNARGVINFAGGWMAERCDNVTRFNVGPSRRPAGPRSCPCCGCTPRTIGTIARPPFARTIRRSRRRAGGRSFTSFRPSVTTGTSCCRARVESGRLPFTTS